jgi:hypothetical protein
MLVVNAHLPILQAGRRYCSACKKFEKIAAIIQQVTYLLKNESYKYNTDRRD